MKRLFFILSLFCVMGLSAQESKMRLMLTKNLTNETLSSVGISPGLLYFINDKIAVGANASWSKYMGFEQQSVEVNARYYVEEKCFIQGGLESDLEDASGFNLGIGYTAFLGKRWFVEPGFRFSSMKDDSRFGMVLGLGLRL